ncbi:hypothetical protein [Micavibrio aeruginosavorus]|uniref:hypothetical protein n=1 Tax=Micavibrio aeruginosavorus TaxID=349221 RepID=UPI003F4AB72E
MTMTDCKKPFHVAAEDTLNTLEYRLRKDPLVIMPVIAMIKKTGDLMDLNARVRAIELLAPYAVSNDSVGHAAFTVFTELARKIVDEDPRRVYRLSVYVIGAMDEQDTRYLKVLTLFNEAQHKTARLNPEVWCSFRP